MAVTNSKVGRFGLFMANPMVAKLDKVEESDSNSLTPKGIALKTIFLLLLTFGGIALFFLTSNFIPQEVVEVESYSVNAYEALIVLGACLIAALGAFLSFKFVRASFLFGVIYSLVQGYALAFIMSIFGTTYLYPALLALLITMVVVLVMLFLYRTKMIKVNKRFTSIIITIFFTGIVLALLYIIASFIPYLDKYIALINSNQVLYILVSIGSVIISTAFLLIDFEVINNCVEKNLPKKYEWLAAFGLSFAIIEVYIRILNLLNIFNNNSNN